MLIAMDAGSCDRALMPSLPLVTNESGMYIDVPAFPGHCLPGGAASSAASDQL